MTPSPMLILPHINVSLYVRQHTMLMMGIKHALMIVLMGCSNRVLSDGVLRYAWRDRLLILHPCPAKLTASIQTTLSMIRLTNPV